MLPRRRTLSTKFHLPNGVITLKNFIPKRAIYTSKDKMCLTYNASA